ncbi:MAG: YggT family protein [Candidatus Daviesbacteria bacterium]|nr:YggT family protein [Candidatus Daviesbacteria bacterium]
MEQDEARVETEEVRTTEYPSQKGYVTQKIIFSPYDIVWYLLSILELLLIFRILLKFVGADPISLFTSSVYTTSDFFALPFSGIISSSIAGKSIMEWSTFVAMAVYWVVIWLIIEFFQLVKPIEAQDMEQTAYS